MSHVEDIRLPQDSLARPLTAHELEEVSGGEFYETDAVKPDTSVMTTGCSPPKNDSDWD